MKKIILSVILCFTIFGTLSAQDRGFEYRVLAGFNIGGTAPIPLARQIRHIDGYNPSLSLMLGADVTRHINEKWGVRSGLKFETKGMTTRAQVRNYQITMNVSDGDKTGTMEGIFTGKVKTISKNAYLTLPVTAVYKFNDRWQVSGGAFVSLLLDGDFNGEAHDGYIREGIPTNPPVGVTLATYDFSDDIRNFNWGAQLGGSWRAFRQFSVFGDMTWAFNSIFKDDFKSISFDMYNIYLNIGFAYTF